MAAIAAGGGDAAHGMLFESLLTSILLLTIVGEDAQGVHFPIIQEQGERAVLVFTDYEEASTGDSYKTIPFRRLCDMIKPANAGMKINQHSAHTRIVPAAWVRAIAEGASSRPLAVTTLTEKLGKQRPKLRPAHDVRNEVQERLREALITHPEVSAAYLVRGTFGEHEALILGLIVDPQVGDDQRAFVARNLHEWVRPLLGGDEIDFLFDKPGGELSTMCAEQGPVFYRRAS